MGLCPRTWVLLASVAACMVGCQQPAQRLFQYSSDASTRAGLVALEDGVLLGNEGGALVRLDRDGKPRWRVALGREVAARPTIWEGAVTAGTVGGELVQLSLEDGQERWRLGGLPPVLTALRSDSTSVYVVAPDGAVRAHALDSGQVRWSRPAPKAEQARLDTSRPLPAPVLAGGLLVVAQGEAGLVALTVGEGTTEWRLPLTQVVGLESEGGALYVSTRDGRVLKLRLADGTKRWEVAPAKALTSPPTLVLERLWVGTGGEQPALLGLSPRTGAVEVRTPLPAPLVARPAVFEELLLVPTSDRQGRLVALRAGQREPTFTLRLDTALRTPPVVLGEQLFVPGQDGRVLSWRLRPRED